MRTVIGIDIGGSTTKIVGFRNDGTTNTLVEPLFVRATDAITSVYGAFGKFTMQNNISLENMPQKLKATIQKAVLVVRLYNADRLQIRIYNNRTDECHASPLEIL